MYDVVWAEMKHQCPSGVHGGGNDALPAGSKRRRHQEPLPEGQEEEELVVGVSSSWPPGEQIPSLFPYFKHTLP